MLKAMRFQYPDERAEEWRKEIVAIESEARESGVQDGLRWHADDDRREAEAASPFVERLGWLKEELHEALQYAGCSRLASDKIRSILSRIAA